MEQFLKKILENYNLAHNGQDPQEIVVSPMALAALGIKKSLRPLMGKIPVKCELFEESSVVKKGQGTRLGVFVYNQTDTALRSCDLV